MVPGGKFLLIRIVRFGEDPGQELQLLELSERHRGCIWAYTFQDFSPLAPQMCIDENGIISLLVGEENRCDEVHTHSSDNYADSMFVGSRSLGLILLTPTALRLCNGR